MFVLGSELYERTFFAGFPLLAQHKCDTAPVSWAGAS